MNLWKIFLIVFIAELPCMIRTVGLQLHSDNLWKIIAGTVAGNFIALFGGLMIAHLLMKTVDLAKFAYLDLLTGGIFILLGLWIMFFGD